ncbi:3-oxoacyl-ACP synthase III family protein [Aliikangiella sp. IMCC44359]|uniref:3-oxoacyl-ACP synthase III family protein n=1 Tax=Aliikangiella sp. IMCC44359 TaxID=3459125 RepID=UPI00403AC0F8
MVTLKSISHFLPEKIANNHYISSIMETSNEFIVERTGLHERRFAEKKTSCSDMAVIAAQRAIKDANITPHDIDCLIVNSLSPDNYDPAMACLIQRKLSLEKIPAFDIRAQCSGFIYASQLAKALIDTGSNKNILVICSELLSKRIDCSNDGRNLSVLLGDGAAAAIYSKHLNKEDGYIVDIDIGADGDNYELLYTKSPGTWAESFSASLGEDNSNIYFRMKGKELFQDAVNNMYQSTSRLLQRNNLNVEDIALFIPHQPNLRILESVAEKMSLKKEQFFINFSQLGNMASASLPVAISMASSLGKLKKGKYIVFLAYGSGSTWGSLLYKNRN